MFRFLTLSGLVLLLPLGCRRADDVVLPSESDTDTDADADADTDADTDTDGPCVDVPLTCSDAPLQLAADDDLTVYTDEIATSGGCGELHVQVPPGTTGVAWNLGLPDGLTAVWDLVGPMGTLLDLDSNTNVLDAANAGQLATVPRITYLSNPAFQIPSDPSVALEPGCYSVRVVDLAFDGRSVPYSLAVNRRPAGERIDLHVGISAGAGISEDEVRDLLSLGRSTIFQPAGLELGDITFQSIGAEWDIVQQGVDQDVFGALTLPDPNAIPLVFVRDVTTADPNSSLLGFAGAIPGPIGVPGTRTSGVVMETLAFESAGLAGGYDGSNALSKTAWHEIGHYLGLRHTTETIGTHDALTDTPECTAATIDLASCALLGADNLMFPIVNHTLPITDIGLTAQQTDVLRAMQPGAPHTCTEHTECGDLEICGPEGTCGPAYSRWYTMFVDGADITSEGPTGAWDADGAPDPFVEARFDQMSAAPLYTFATQADTYQPSWDGEESAFVRLTSPGFNIVLRDEDPSQSEPIDEWIFVPTVDDLRSTDLSWPATHSTLHTGFEAQ